MGMIINILTIVVIVGALFYFYPNEMNPIADNSKFIANDIKTKAIDKYQGYVIKKKIKARFIDLLNQHNITDDDLMNISNGLNVSSNYSINYSNIDLCIK